MSNTSATTLEVAVFTVRNPKEFDSIQAETHALLSKMPGFIRSVRYRKASEPALRADLVAWESLAAAGEAAKKVQKDPQFAPLMSSIDQIRIYGHYALPVEPTDFLGGLSGSPVTEIAAYSVADGAAARGVQAKVYDALRSHAGYRLGAPGQQHEDSKQLIDVIAWTAPEACQAASAALQSVPEFASFFSSITEMKLFEMFVPVA